MRLVYITLIALLALSCSESKMLQKSLNSFNAPIGYLHDSQKTDVPATDSLIIRLNDYSLDSLTRVTHLKGLVLPFIVFDYVEVNMGVKLGQKSIQDPYSDFFAGSLADESFRTGWYGISNRESSDSLYTLEITIDTCTTTAKYRHTSMFMYLFFAYSMSYSEMGFPAETNLQVSTKLWKGNALITEKRYSIKRKQPFIQAGQVNGDKLRSNFTANMVESLSLSTKQCIEEMVRDINSSIKQDKNSGVASVK